MNLNKQFTILLVSCITLLSMGVSCKDKNKKSYCEENPDKCEVVTASKSYFYFNVGSWWVYEEETSLERDSLYVIEANHVNGGYNFDVRIQSSLTDYIYHYWPTFITTSSCSVSNPVSKKCIYINRSKGKSGDFVGQDYCFFLQATVNDYETVTGNVFYPNNKIIIDNILSEYSNSQYTFGKTYVVKELSTRIEGIQPTKHFFSKDVGLIRKELLDSNQVWNLVNYHIVT